MGAQFFVGNIIKRRGVRTRTAGNGKKKVMSGGEESGSGGEENRKVGKKNKDETSVVPAGGRSFRRGEKKSTEGRTNIKPIPGFRQTQECGSVMKQAGTQMVSMPARKTAYSEKSLTARGKTGH